MMTQILLNTIERRLSGDGLTGGRLNRALKFDWRSIVRNICIDSQVGKQYFSTAI